ncbi:MAG: ATP-binding protein [Flavobacteriaceae bacterium]|nr:ATP-binding protein [Flavobacteriaceae bacterium]
MSLSASEKSTLHFYLWEYQYRGYYHFDTPVDIEVPYVPFRYISLPSSTLSIDDGRVPTFVKQITNFLSSSKEVEKPTQEIDHIKPKFLAFEDKPKLVGISLSFPKETEILPSRNIEFLNMLSYTEQVLSFEIIGKDKSISIQIVCSEQDMGRVQSQLKAYFPLAVIRDIEIDSFGFDLQHDLAIADFALNDEHIRCISTADSFVLDPLTSVIAVMESLDNDDIVVFQILFKGITSPLANDISYAVSDGVGGSFFSDAPEMPHCAKEKISSPLFSVVMRIATQGNSNIRSQYLAQELSRSISTISRSAHNKLIPLSNEGYNYDFHYYNLHHRLSNRLGFVLNSKELNTFLHYPNRTIVSKKIGLQGGKTKQVPKETIHQKYLIGTNKHNGVATKVMLNDEMRLRHTHIIGATGTGKSTLMANMMLEDMKAGNGCALFDPHGDIVEDVLLRIPEHRKNDVILINPYDIDFPTGFNMLHAHTDAEKIVLSSDMVSAFKRYATSWGDTMSSVLSQAVTTFLESDRGGTLIELKRFLLEDKFRKEFLQNVDDPSIHYYWNNEYSYLKKRIAPLLTRIDTFLRPKIVRYMLAQKNGIDFRECIDKKKIVLIKLSQGLIGEDNSYLLGSLFLSKFNQVAQSRQNLVKNERHPYYIYCDEFHNFITPSISKILSGARKYGIGLTLAHQELSQIEDVKTLNSVIANPYIRICFRLGDIDARKLDSGFSSFSDSDLLSLQTGQTIIRFGGANKDFNCDTFPLSEIDTKYSSYLKEYVIQQSRNKYTQSRAKVEQILHTLLPQTSPANFTQTEQVHKEPEKEIPLVIIPKPILQRSFEEQKQTILEKAEAKEQERKHRTLQNYIKVLASQRGYRTIIEKQLDDGKRIDVVIEKDTRRIAFEVSVTNSIDYEVQNLLKCISHGFEYICSVCDGRTHLTNIKNRIQEYISKEDGKILRFFDPSELNTFLDSLEEPQQINTKRIRGYRVKSNRILLQGKDAEYKNQALKNIITKPSSKKK